MIRHLVLMRFTDPADAAEAKARLEALVGQVPELRSLWVGLDALGTDGAFHLALDTTFDDTDGLDAYAAHPAHVDGLAWLRPRLAARAVVDAEVLPG